MAARPTATASDATPLSGRKRIAFTVAMLLVPVLFFILAEGILRIAGYGEDYPLFEPVENHEDFLVQGREVARRYFVHTEDVPNSQYDYFHRVKPENGFRIFVQGGSSAAGFPFYYGAAFPRQLEQRLQQTFPDRTVEVINTSMSAVNSYTLLDLADEILEHEPDAVLIYAGHNEYFGALGAASAESLGRNPALVRTYLGLQRFRLVQAMRGGLAALARARAGERSGPPSNTLMARMVGEQQVPLDSEVYEAGLAQFRSNLSLLLARYAEAGVPVFIGTVASNERDHQPFLNVFEVDTDEAAYEAAVRAGRAALQAGDAETAQRRLAGATAMDTLAADGFYWLGHAHLAAGAPDAAQEAFLQARERDALRFRAPAAINASIRALSAEHGATLVESEAHLRAVTPDGLIGQTLMIEHLHPTIAGYTLLADAFYDRLRDTEVLGADWSRAVPDSLARPRYTTVDSLAGLLRVQQLMTGWPFRPGEAPATTLLDVEARSRVEQIAVDLYEKEASWRGATDALATHYATAGRFDDAIHAREAIVQEYPFLSTTYVDLANLLVEQGRTTGDAALLLRAEEVYAEALVLSPENAAVTGLLGALKLQRGAHGEAIALLERARRLDATNTQVLYNLSGAYALDGQIAEARATAEAVLAVDQNHAAARALLASLPQ